MTGPESGAPCVFIVEDDVAVGDSLVMLVELLGLPVERFASADEFLARYDGRRPGCLLMDIRLPGMSGVKRHEKLVRDGVRLPTIFVTGHGAAPPTEEARRAGVVAVLEKPCRAELLVEAIREAIGRAGIV